MWDNHKPGTYVDEYNKCSNYTKYQGSSLNIA